MGKERKETPTSYHYEIGKRINGGEQMREVWTMPAKGCLVTPIVVMRCSEHVADAKRQFRAGGAQAAVSVSSRRGTGRSPSREA